MLYDMSEDRFEQSILLPVLEEYEKECTKANKYDFYFESVISGISFRETKSGEISLWHSSDVSKNIINFIHESTNQYITRTRGFREEGERQRHADEIVFDYIVKNYDYTLEKRIESSVLTSDQTVYELLKDTWIGEKIKIMSTLSETLKNNQELMRLDVSNLMD